jgi:hypothetical protein
MPFMVPHGSHRKLRFILPRGNRGVFRPPELVKGNLLGFTESPF